METRTRHGGSLLLLNQMLGDRFEDMVLANEQEISALQLVVATFRNSCRGIIGN